MWYCAYVAKTRIMLRIDPERLAAVDAVAGDRGRTAFIERAIDAALALPASDVWPDVLRLRMADGSVMNAVVEKPPMPDELLTPIEAARRARNEAAAQRQRTAASRPAGAPRSIPGRSSAVSATSHSSASVEPRWKKAPKQ